jgi:hypothetical protein
MLVDWGQKCGALTIDMSVVAREDPRPRLRGVRVPADPGYVPLVERERARARLAGFRRPPSLLLYPYIGYLRINGLRWIPFSPSSPVIATWAEKLRR